MIDAALIEEAKCYVCLGVSLPDALELALLARIAEGEAPADCGALSGADSPVGVVTPEFVGQLYNQGSGTAFFYSTGLTSADWVEISSGLGDGLIWGPTPETVDSVAGASDAFTVALTALFPTTNYTDLSFGQPTTVTNGVDFSNSGTTTSIAMRLLETVGTDLLIPNLTVGTALEFPNLQSVGGSITITAAGALTTLDFPSLTTVDTIDLTNSAMLASFTAAQLVTITSDFIFSGTVLTVVSLPALQTTGPWSIETTLTTVSLPSLVSEGTILTDLVAATSLDTLTLGFPTVAAALSLTPWNATLASASFPNLTAIGGTFDMSGLTALTSLSVPSLVSIGGAFSAGGTSPIATINLPSLTTVTLDVDFSSTSVSSFSAPLWLPTNGTTITFNGAALDAASVNHVLARCVAAGVTTCTIELIGGTNEPPTGQGITDKADLITAGNTVLTN